MTTLGELRAEVRLTLADAATWPDATLDAYIAAGIRLYSAHFPRPRRAALELTPGQQVYDLPGGEGLHAVLRVELARDGEPAHCLAAADEDSTAFRAGEPVYAVRGVGETDALGQLVFAEPVVAGMSATVEYLASHPLPAAGDDTAQLTVPDAHLEAITAYVRFAAYEQLVAGETQNVSTDSGLALSPLRDTAHQAWLYTKDVLDRLLWLGPGYQPPVSLPVWEL